MQVTAELTDDRKASRPGGTTQSVDLGTVAIELFDVKECIPP